MRPPSRVGAGARAGDTDQLINDMLHIVWERSVRKPVHSGQGSLERSSA
jgi:hypothetical protein